MKWLTANRSLVREYPVALTGLNPGRACRTNVRTLGICLGTIPYPGKSRWGGAAWPNHSDKRSRFCPCACERLEHISTIKALGCHSPGW